MAHPARNLTCPPILSPLQEVALRCLIAEANQRLGANPRRGDFGRAQTVAGYASPRAQWQYVHMYALKHVVGWATVRDRLGWDLEPDRPLVSVGAGPMLGLLGWTAGHAPPQDIRAIDVLRWEAVRRSGSGQILARALGMPDYLDGVFGPMPAPGKGRHLPAELRDVPVRRQLRPTDIPHGATVLFPMVLNHLLENGALPDTQSSALGHTIRVLQSRGCRVVIGDLATQRRPQLWPELTALLGLTTIPRRLGFHDALQSMGDLHHERDRAYRTSWATSWLRFVAWDGKRWVVPG